MMGTCTYWDILKQQEGRLFWNPVIINRDDSTQGHMCRCSQVGYKSIDVMIKSEMEKIEIELLRANML